MSIQAELAEYEALIQARADADVKVRVWEKRQELRALARKPKEHDDENEQFIADHQAELFDFDLEFLEQEYRGIGEVWEYLGGENGPSRSTIKRRIPSEKQGERHRWKTLEVVRYQLDARTEEET